MPRAAMSLNQNNATKIANDIHTDLLRKEKQSTSTYQRLSKLQGKLQVKFNTGFATYSLIQGEEGGPDKKKTRYVPNVTKTFLTDPTKNSASHRSRTPSSKKELYY